MTQEREGHQRKKQTDAPFLRFSTSFFPFMPNDLFFLSLACNQRENGLYYSDNATASFIKEHES